MIEGEIDKMMRAGNACNKLVEHAIPEIEKHLSGEAARLIAEQDRRRQEVLWNLLYGSGTNIPNGKLRTK